MESVTKQWKQGNGNRTFERNYSQYCRLETEKSVKISEPTVVCVTSYSMDASLLYSRKSISLVASPYYPKLVEVANSMLLLLDLPCSCPLRDYHAEGWTNDVEKPLRRATHMK